MLFRDVMGVCYEKYIQFINALWERNEFLASQKVVRIVTTDLQKFNVSPFQKISLL
jgi:hypothetical protein